MISQTAGALFEGDRALWAVNSFEGDALVFQAAMWRHENRADQGHLTDRTDYQLPGCPPAEDGRFQHQLLPSISYMDADTWTNLPTVVVEVMYNEPGVDYEFLRCKLATFVASGTREAVLIDTIGDRSQS